MGGPWRKPPGPPNDTATLTKGRYCPVIDIIQVRLPGQFTVQDDPQELNLDRGLKCLSIKNWGMKTLQFPTPSKQHHFCLPRVNR
jgi:hypothetical protein